MMGRMLLMAVVVCTLSSATPGFCQSAVELPSGVKAVWDLDKAYREKTPTRERVCINGLWRWQPAGNAGDALPTDGWGYFKVPGCWPGITDYMQKDSQTLYAHPSWQSTRLGDVTAAWYQREITIPAEWAGRRVTVYAEYLNSFATVYVDGQRAGEMRFPSGEVDVTSSCAPGTKHVLSMLVLAMPLKAVMMSYSDTMGAKEVRGSVERRGLCGDVYLDGTPSGPRIADAMVETSVRKWEITFAAELQGLSADGRYTLRAGVTDGGRSVGEFASNAFQAADLKDGRFTFTASWKPEKLWDLNTPQNTYQLDLSLVDAGGKVLDAALPSRFGFREFWIDGRDFYLNGTRVFLCGVPLNNAQIGAALSTYDAVRETLARLKTFGVNYVYTHNYGCEPGTHLTFEEALRAADDEGMLVGLSQPHFGQYDWRAADADQNNGYARHATFYVHVAGTHPSVVFYPMSHNATGYGDDMSPGMIDGITDPRPDWAKNGIKPALRAEAIVKAMDPARIVYHHSSGNLSAMYTLNFYVNFTPVQELSDWFEHWATAGVKPFFTCEYGVPCTWDWTMYRGWYKGGRTFGSARVPWEFCLAEWNSQFLGDQAFKISEMEKTNLRWEAKQFRAGNLWYRWDYPNDVGEPFDERYPVFAMYIADNFRAFRTLNMSATNVWEYGHYWKLRPGADRGRKNLKVDWNGLQRPGLSPDYVEGLFEWMDVAYGRSDWVPTVASQALVRNNMPLLAYIGGKASAVTSKDHDFYPGETVEKQLVVINNSRQTVTADCAWSGEVATGTKTVSVETGQQARVPLSMPLPANTKPGRYELTATVKFSNGETQKDSFFVDVLARPAALQAGAKVALFDPKGETATLLRQMGVAFDPVDANADLSGYGTLIVGKAALTPDGPAPDISRVRDGLKVVMFEQTSDVLQNRFGFRVEEYGLRWAFKRVPDHPLLTGIADEHLWNWRGEATILPPSLKYEKHPYSGEPQVKWCDIMVSRVYRVGNRGNVASVLIEKPARGDFMPILDGGFSLQFSPLMEYREGKGMVLFCQMDVTGRTESDPAAEALTNNILRYVSTWKPSAARTVVYAGDALGKSHLERLGLSPAVYEGGNLSADQVLVVGAGGAQKLAGSAAAVADFVKAGGDVLAVGLDEQGANAFLPTKVGMKKAEHIAAYFDKFGKDSLLAGVGPADVHNRDPRDLPLVSAGADVIGDGVLAKARDANVVFCQLAPYDVTAAQGEIASFVVDGGDAADGKQSALVTLGSTGEAGAQFGQQVKVTPQVGSTYTFAVLVKAVGQPLAVHLEVERAGSPWDRAVRGDNVQVGTDAWKEIHATFRVEKPFAEGWQPYIVCAQEGGQYRADMFQLYEGEYVPSQAPAQGAGQAARANLITNPSFEAGPAPWWFNGYDKYNVRRTFRRASYLMTRLLANMGAAGATPVLERFHSPVDAAKAEKRWLNGLYLDTPQEWDDPYRFFCW